MEGLRWFFEMRDRISGPAKRATGGMKRLRDELRGTTRELDRFNRGGAGRGSRGATGFDPRAMREIGRNAQVTGGALGRTTSGLTTMVSRLGVALGMVGGIYLAFRRVAGVVGDLAGAVGGLVQSFAGGVIEAGASRLRALTGMRALLGDGAQDALRDAEELSDFLGTDLHETVSALQSMMAQGFGARESRTLFQGLADLQTINPAANISSLTLAIGQIRSKGRLMAEELMQLTEAGLNRGAVLEQIGAARGLSGDRNSIVRQVEQLMSGGRVGSDEALRAIMSSISATTGQEIGGLARSASQGLPGLLTRLENAPQRIFAAIASDSTGAFSDLEELLRSVTGFLDPASQGFRDFISIASGAFSVLVDVMRTAWDVGVAFFSGLFGEASESTDPIEDIRAGLQDVRGWLVSLRESGTLDDVREFGQEFMRFARAVWPLVKAFAALVLVVTTWAVLTTGFLAIVAIAIPAAFLAAASVVTAMMFQMNEMISTGFADLRARAETWGHDIVEGLSTGMQSGVDSLRTAVTGIRDTVVGRVMGAFEMGSPSRLMAELGEYAAQGFGQGLESMPEVNVPTPELGAGVGESNRAAAGGPSLTFNIEVNGAGDAQATAQAVHEVVLESLREVFGRAAGEYRGAFG